MKWIVHYIIVLKYCAEEVENNVDWWFFHYHNSIMSVQNFFFTLLNNLCSLFFFYQTVSVTQESHWHTFTCDILVSSVKLVSGFYLNHDYICISWCKLWSIFFFWLFITVGHCWSAISKDQFAFCVLNGCLSVYSLSDITAAILLVLDVYVVSYWESSCKHGHIFFWQIY